MFSATNNFGSKCCRRQTITNTELSTDKPEASIPQKQDDDLPNGNNIALYTIDGKMESIEQSNEQPDKSLKEIMEPNTKNKEIDSDEKLSATKTEMENHSQMKLQFDEQFVRNISNITQYLREENNELQERSMLGEIESEWKAMARVVDSLCLKIYLALLLICHAAILIAAVLDHPLEPELHKDEHS